MKLFLFFALAAVAYSAPMINDKAFVDHINSQPGLLWKAGMNPRFTNAPLSALKSLTGVTPDSWGMVQALPKAVSNISNADIPDSFDSETNWPHCAKVIGDIRDQAPRHSTFCSNRTFPRP